jgi:tetratricopeptide (TPR) repeat protein
MKQKSETFTADTGPKSRFWRYRWWPVLALASTVILLHLGLAIFTNAGNLALVQSVVDNHGEKSVEQRTESLKQARTRFEQALAIAEHHLPARWGSARATLALGELGVRPRENNAAAAAMLQPLAADASQNLLLYLDAQTALNRNNDYESVIALYETHPPLSSTPQLSDTIALAYIVRGTPDDLARAQKLRPGDLYASYHLWKDAKEVGDLQSATNFSDTLRYFPLEAIMPTDELLLEYTTAVIPTLLDEGIWDQEKASNVLAVLVWRYATEAVHTLLEQLVESYPEEPIWPFYLAELYHREGHLDQASAAYNRAMDIDPHFIRAYLRLGLIDIARSNEMTNEQQLEDAANWLRQYLESAPADILGLTTLTEVCTALERFENTDPNCVMAAHVIRNQKTAKGTSGQKTESTVSDSPASILKDELETRTNDRTWAAELLGVLPEQIELGPNLINEAKDDYWRWVPRVGGEFSRGLFINGTDGLEISMTHRIDVPWTTEQEGLFQTRADLRSPELSLSSQHRGVGILSFWYKALGRSRVRAASMVDTEPMTWQLPGTYGQWHRAAILIPVKDSSSIAFSLRITQNGSTQFHNVTFRELIRLGPSSEP